MSEMAISVEDGERGTRVVVTGDLDLSAGDALEGLVSPLISAAHPVEIALGGVDFMDSSGLGALLALSQLARDSGVDLRLRNPSRAVVAALDLTQTTDLFTLI